MKDLSLSLAVFLSLLCSDIFATDTTPCQWDSKTGAIFNLQPLKVEGNTLLSYQLTDGDIPCTPEVETSYVYSWNFCADITKASLTPACMKSGVISGVAHQSFYYGDQIGQFGCKIIGTYDQNKDDSISYKLLDQQDPSLGLSITYPKGDLCSTTSTSLNTKVYQITTIEIQCANVKASLVSANSPRPCENHITMKSYYGCPTVR